ncbi:sulfite exporter TauE/SafE family protein [Paenibacillus yanchengensis]|uniref:Probable membrane transporter protein n=1 Tax=Paenibacillus yanchengensis TaxID=2035833 RepID=A0ABW4YI64_9BACL
MEWVLFVFLGIAAATFGSIVGLGGGIIIVPMLLLFGGALTGAPIEHPVAVGVSLCVLVFTALASTMTYRRRKLIDYKSALILFVTSGPASMLGSALTGKFESNNFQLSFGIFMLAMAILLISREYMKPTTVSFKHSRTITDGTGQVHTYSYSVPILLGMGFAVGAISGLFGIGGGSLFVPLMVLLFRFPPHVATATSMSVIFLSALLGSGMHIVLGEVNWLLVLILAPGAWIGGKLGATIAAKMSGKSLLWLLRITILVLALVMIADGMNLL